MDVDLGARVVFLPVRHHSPACAWHVDRLIRAIRPDVVLIEGPRDATPMIPLLTHPKARMPVAIYTTYVRRGPDRSHPSRHAAYYPLCDYSPELAAIRAAGDVGARARFIDLTFPEMVAAGRDPEETRAASLLDEREFSHSRLLREACARVGARDFDDLWDHLYEADFRDRDPADFFRGVLAYCDLARRDSSTGRLAAEGCLAREGAMAWAVAEEPGRVVVVTGGFHTVALPSTDPARPVPVPSAEGDALVALMRYGFEQLDRLNGYASGMPSPEFYQRLWEGEDVSRLVVELGREGRRRKMPLSVADEIAATDQARRLAALRGHPAPTREDLLDGVRSAFIKGSDDVEGVAVLALARELLAGDRVGDVPPEAGSPPIVVDFRREAGALKVELDRVDARDLALDLYRKARGRRASRFFHRLRFLGVPFAEWTGGPDYVSGEDLDRVQEHWKYRWTPAVESTLIERSLYGATLAEASAAMLLERFDEADGRGVGRRADGASALILEACRMGLHARVPELLGRTARLVAEDGSFASLVRAAEILIGLHVAREPLEAHDLEGPAELAAAAIDRACYLLPALTSTAEADEPEALDALNALGQAARTLGDSPDRRDLRSGALAALADAPGGSSAVRGGAVGLLFGEGRIGPEALVDRLRGHLLSPVDDGRAGAGFLRGLLRTARSVLWTVPECIDGVHDALRGWDEARFVSLLPELRLAFADLTPRESDRLAAAVADRAGAGGLAVSSLGDHTEADLLRGVEVNRRVLEEIRREGWEDIDRADPATAPG